MSKIIPKPSNASKIKRNESFLHIPFLVILLAYVIVPVATPIMEAFDANGPKFLAIATLNFLSLAYILTTRYSRSQPGMVTWIFRNWTGRVYLLFLFIVLLSFVKSINLYESIINFSKIFTIFSAAYIISLILKCDKRYLTFVAASASILLLFDSLTVFYQILKYIGGAFGRIYEIKSVYSNKNILAAAIFVKLPFALYLFTFRKGYLRLLGLFAMFCAILANYYMSTRTFYIGIIGISLAYLLFCSVGYFRNNDKWSLYHASTYLGMIIIAYFIFWGTQKFLYPKIDDVYNVGFAERLSTIGGGGGRFNAWIQSLMLTKENPVLGVGTGNWKIQVLKYENKLGFDYTYMYKNHNDFLETFAETGLLGGISFVAIFLVIGGLFIRSVFHKNGPRDDLPWQFLAAFGVFAYSFDAFFNFPADRPEIGALFATYIAISIAISSVNSFFYGKTRKAVAIANSSPHARVSDSSTLESGPSQDTSNTSYPANLISLFTSRFSTVATFIFTGLLFILMSGAIYVFIQNFRSIKLQRIVKGEMASGKLTSPSEMFMTGFPVFPTVSLEGEPIAVHKARYLINEGKLQQAIEILKTDHSSPYDTRQEFFISMAYFQLNNIDSSLVYSLKVFENKPFFFNNTGNLCRTLENKGKRNEAIQIMDIYLKKVKTNTEAWMLSGALYDNGGNYKMAASILDSAAKYLPTDTIILKQQRALNAKVKIKPFEALYFKAIELFNQKKYPEAINKFSVFINQEPSLADAYDFRAFCYFFINDYQKSLADIERAFALAPVRANLLNLRGVNFHLLGNDEAACKDFDMAVKMGDKDAANNMEKFCQKNKK